MGRSLKLSQEGKLLVEQALNKKGLTRTTLQKRINISRATLSKFFNEKPISSDSFVQICDILGLNPIDVTKSEESKTEKLDINLIVQEVRNKIAPDVEQHCGTMQVLDMTYSIELGDIYTDVNILETITERQRKTIKELQDCLKLDLENFDRLGWGEAQKRIPGLTAVENNPKLMVWGKPGGGKTTFLKYIAIECIKGCFKSKQVPLFITLKEFAETRHHPNLLTYITQRLKDCQVKAEETEQVLQQGRGLILLDGLDEVRNRDCDRIIKQIQQFAIHPQSCQNQMLITCRIAAREYIFQGFKEVEVADFNKQQIETFTNNWFQEIDAVKAKRFIKKLKENKAIQELATSPLLLTLLCLVFGERGDLPKNRAELYEEGVDILLKKWDAKRNIERDQVYKQLSVKRKEDLLSQIALTTFQQGDYFFKQKTVEGYIAEFIENLPDAKSDPEALRLDSEQVLKSIEAQHGLLVARAKGIYSFSHLTFQEYFTARKLVTRPNSSGLREFVSYLTEKRWREVFLLAVEMIDDATELVSLMKEECDRLVAKDKKIQEFLRWLQEKASSVEVSYKPEDFNLFIKKLKLALSLEGTLTIIFYFALILYFDLHLDFHSNLNFYLSLNLDLDLNIDFNLILYFYFYNYPFERVISPIDDINFKAELQNLNNQLPDRNNKYQFKKWWKVNGQAWREQLRSIMIKYRNIGHDWQFTHEQKELLNKYYKANQLLMECLNRECIVNRQVRHEIEDTLFLPIEEIEKRKHKP